MAMKPVIQNQENELLAATTSGGGEQPKTVVSESEG
jgi:hypothetical protein